MAGQPSTTNQSTSSPSNVGGVAGTATTSPSTSNPSGTATGAIGSNAGGGTAMAGASSSSSAPVSVGINDSATLQGQIQNALQSEPTLHNDNLSVNVNDNTIELSGNVQTSKEKETARRIASSFAGNRRVKDRVTVSGHGTASTNPSSSTMGTNPAGNSSNNQQNNPTNNPNPQNPSSNNPAANGDASTNPR